MLELNDIEILNKVVECFHDEIAGEDDNIKIIFLVGLSKFLPPSQRCHLIVHGQSSAGKSFLVHKIFNVFRKIPEEELDKEFAIMQTKIINLRAEIKGAKDKQQKINLMQSLSDIEKEFFRKFDPWADEVIEATRITKAALDRAVINLDGKIFIYEQIAQHQNDETAIYLRPLLSEGRLILMTVKKNPETGEWQTVVLPTAGFPVFVTTTTTTFVDPEFLNRVVLISVDESEEQTRKILQKIAEDFSIPENLRKKMSRVEEVRELIKKITEKVENFKIALSTGLDLEKIHEYMIPQVIIPYAEKLVQNFPPVVTARRDFRKALALTAAYTFLHQYHRPKVVIKRLNAVIDAAVISQPVDFFEVCKFAAKSLAETLLKTTVVEIDLLKKLREVYKGELPSAWFTTNDVVQMRVMQYTRRKIKEMLDHLTELNYLERDESTRPHRYRILEDPPEVTEFAKKIMLENITVDEKQLKKMLCKETVDYDILIIQPPSHSINVNGNTEAKKQKESFLELEKPQKMESWPYSNLLSFLELEKPKNNKNGEVIPFASMEQEEEGEG